MSSVLPSTMTGAKSLNEYSYFTAFAAVAVIVEPVVISDPLSGVKTTSPQASAGPAASYVMTILEVRRCLLAVSMNVLLPSEFSAPNVEFSLLVRDIQKIAN